jgi:hypothetical protein
MIIHCLGGGLVGSFVIRRLINAGYKVHIFDIDDVRIKGAIMHVGDAITADHSDVDLIINMLPGEIGHLATASLSNTGQRILDLSFSVSTPDNLENVTSTIIWDVGIAPGLSNMLLSMAVRKYGALKKAMIKVGGNPSEMDDGWSYMAPFSPKDVIAEYTRPARIIRNGAIQVVPAMSDLHKISANGRVMDAFLTDGLRSILHGIPAKEMGEYTVRWPGHIQRYQAEQDRIVVDDLIEEWKFDENRPEFTWMEVTAVTLDDLKLKWIVEDQGLDGDSSMARTTGLVTAQTAIAWLNQPDLFTAGVYSPENLPNEIIQLIIEVMQAEGVSIKGPIIE